jgi:predicted MFS family arabinose efflux permease
MNKNNSLSSEKIILFILAAIQFVNVLDFVIIMPLGPQFMRVFEINPKQFGIIVSSYTFSASFFGFLGAFFLDKFDRKKSLIVLLSGFSLGTLLCAISPNYMFLVLARIIAGAFGGVMGATTFSIIGDVIPPERRGQATGFVMSGFALASVLGIPIGLYLANIFDWHAPFYMLAISSSLIVPFAVKYLPKINTHLENKIKKNPFVELKELFSDKNHIKAFTLTIMLTIAGFSVIPYLSPYMVANVGLTEKQLPFIYLTGGFCTLFTAQIIGKISDKYGKRKIFITMALFSTIPVLIITNLSKVPLEIALFITSLFMIAISGRVIPSMAMITGSVKPQYRGSFMSINSSVQNMGSGLAAVISGNIISKSSTGEILNYNYSGYLSVLVTLLCVYLSTKLNYEESSKKVITKEISESLN